MNPAAPSPSDSSIAQAFRESVEHYRSVGPLNTRGELVDRRDVSIGVILNRAREIDASAPAAAVGGVAQIAQEMHELAMSFPRATMKEGGMAIARLCTRIDVFSDRLAALADTPAAPVGCNCGASVSGDDDQRRHSADCSLHDGAAPVGGFVVVPKDVKTAALLLDMGLKFALCHRDFGDTRNAIKNLQKESQIIYDWTKAGREVCERCNGTRVMVSDNHDEAECTYCTPTAQPSPHTTEDDYQHFLAYSGLDHTPLLQYAYYHGADVGLDKPKDAAQPSAKDGGRVEGVESSEVLAWFRKAMTGRDHPYIDHIISALEATTGAGLVEWRWVDEKGRAMTNWKQSEPPPMRKVSDMKGTMRVEIREAAIGREVSK